MNFNILITAGIALLTIPGTQTMAQQPQAAVPQQQGRPRPRADEKIDMQVNRVDSVVHLAPDQKVQLRQLFATINEQKRQNKAAAAGDREKLKELNKPLAKQANDGLKRILTPEQWAMLKQERRDIKTQKMQNSQPVPQPGR